MFENLKNAFKDKGIRKKIFITLILLLVFRIGCYIPIPGIDSASIGSSISSNQFLSIMSAITGGALQNGTLLALGISPYINASIIMQLLTVGIPALERMSKDGGEEGRKKISQITRYVTLFLALVQAIGIVVSLNAIDKEIFLFDGIDLTWLTYVFVVVILTAGTAFTMWLGERITEHGVGNGISLIIFVGIVAHLGSGIVAQVQAMFTTGVSSGGLNYLWVLLGFLVMVVIVFAFIVFVDLAERRIPVQYAKQIKGRRMYGGQSTVIPIRVNGSGVLPLIFAFAFLSFPELIANMFWPDSGFSQWWAQWLGSSSQYPFYSIILVLLIFAFAYFYAQIQFNPEDVSKQIQSYGGFIQGIRPGKPTTDYLKKVSKRITLFGAFFLAIVALVPSVLFAALSQVEENAGIMNAFSATGLMIIVSVALEFDKQLESQIVMKVQKGFLK